MTEFHFSTDQFPEHKRVAVWREVFGEKIVKLDMEPPRDQPFRGKVSVKALPDLAIGSIASTANRITRTPRLIANGSDDIMLGIVLQGQAVVAQKGQGEVIVGCGEAVVWLNSSIGHSHYTAPIEFLSVAVPRSVLVRNLVHPDRMALSLIPRESEALRLLTGYLQVLLCESVGPETHTLVSAHIHDLVAMALGRSLQKDAKLSGPDMRAARMRAIKADIESNLGHQQLTINSLALRHGISARSIRDLFAKESTTFTDYIMGQRLELAYRLLTDPRFADCNISAIAFESGFGDISHFNHMFRRRYRATPTEIRTAAFKR